MTNRERFDAVLNYKKYDRLPMVHFGYWAELIEKWEAEGHLCKGTAEKYRSLRFPNGSDIEKEIDSNFGFEVCMFNVVFVNRYGYMDILDPMFEHKVLKELPNGNKHEVLPDGTIALQKYDENGHKVPGIPAFIGYTLQDRDSWEKEYLPRLQWSEDRVNHELLKKLEKEAPTREDVICLYGGSIVGILRNYLGLENMIMLQATEPELFEEMVTVQADIQYKLVERALEYNIHFDYCYIWEDLTSAVGPLVSPCPFEEVAGPHYRRLTKLLRDHGVNNIVLDSDGIIDALVPTWLNNGVNTMFPLEYGTWEGSFALYRQKYGKGLKGIGGVRKQALGESREAIDAEIERIKPIVEMGGYLPAPDHSLPLECDWNLTRYYVDRMRETFG